ncbi:50S ribosomal protein L4 [Taibaiella sp. KBW10]|uniref:50S ribosomal protein L4 n=1 Tax=Taibaiella sp. KBW10 TaxID=2153357 RepID=UPI000F59B219|nr:50S ribosomal protein L4 [Taibaiella sp. KBW10]RQO31545.1 50S ribosomal protein L4 [Taibaiella sp. KBW10]
MQIEVLNSKGEKTGRSVELPEDIFNIEPNDHVVYLAVKQYLAARRLGTHKTKTRAEVKGSSRKLHRQKGTGGSRKGNIRNPLYKGGGTINGPLPHSYDFKLNRKVKDLAKMSALTYKAKENSIVVVEDIKIDAPSTKQMLALLNSLKIADQKLLLVNADYDANFYLSVRNIPKVKASVLSDINTYDILNAKTLVLTESAAKVFTDVAVEVEA